MATAMAAALANCSVVCRASGWRRESNIFRAKPVKKHDYATFRETSDISCGHVGD